MREDTILFKVHDSVENLELSLNNRIQRVENVTNTDNQKKLAARELANHLRTKEHSLKGLSAAVAKAIKCMSLESLNAIETMAQVPLTEVTDCEVMDPDLPSPLKPILVDPSFGLTCEVIAGDVDTIGSLVQVRLTVEYDRGSITPALGTSGYRSGEATSYTWSHLGDPDYNVESPIDVYYTVDGLPKEWELYIEYEPGEQPLDGSGVDYDHPYPGGSFGPLTCEVEAEVKLPYYATTANIDDIPNIGVFLLAGSGKIEDLLQTDEHGDYIFIDVSGAARQNDVDYEGDGYQYPFGFRIPSEWGDIHEVRTEFAGAWYVNNNWETVTPVDVEVAPGYTFPYNEVQEADRGETGHAEGVKLRVYLSNVG